MPRTKYSSQNGSRKKAGLYICHHCGSRFMFKNSLIRHLDRFHQKLVGVDNIEYEDMTEEQREEAGIYSCYNCEELFQYDDMKHLPHGQYCPDCYSDIYG